MSKAEEYLKTTKTEMIPYYDNMDVTNVSVSKADRDNGSPKVGDMIAINPFNSDDKWLIAKKYFKENYIKADFSAQENKKLTELLEAVLLDISIDIQNELLIQCKKAECDDYQTDLINENTIAVFNLNKQKYIARLMQVK
jgi:hypothetical protein